MRFFLVFIFVVSTAITATAGHEADSIYEKQAFTLQEFFNQIMLHHPIASQARFMDSLALQDIRMAKGLFDPKIKSGFHYKNFKGTQYYNQLESKLSIPTWFGPDILVGYEQHRGKYLNAEYSNAVNGQISMGVAVPIGKGLIIDARRTAVKQAELMTTMARAERIKMINKLLFSAAKDYWAWYFAYQNYQAITEILNLAETRYEGIVQEVENGDLAPFDSLKALINFQERKVAQKQAELEYQNAGIIVSNYMWFNEGNSPQEAVPLELAEEAAPIRDTENLDWLEGLSEMISFARQNHPEIIKLDMKIRQLEVQQRLNRENLKPQIDVRYNFLNEPTSIGLQTSEGESVFINDYKLGVDFSFPLFLRKERAKIEQTKIKLEQNFFDRTFTTRTIENDIIAVYNNVLNTNRLIGLQEQMVNNYTNLLQGEVTKFDNGESSLFLINTRETELMNAKIKLYKLQTTLEKEKINLLYKTGLPNLDRTIE
jgi:outer membrane protein TolC